MRFFKHIIIGCLLVMPYHLVFAQKQTLQTINASEITTLQIESNEVFKITMITSKTNDITIKTESEGEYFQNIALITELTGTTLKLTSKYPEILTSGYDKLSAHKVFAVQVYLEIPENLKVSILSNVASVFAKGTYKNLQIQLKSGQTELKDFKGNLTVNTYNGNILVETNNANVEATSRNGSITNTLNVAGEYVIKLNSIDGHIVIRPSQ